MDVEKLLYSDTHEWVNVVEEDGAQVAWVGITAFAVQQLTDLVYMELPQVGRQLNRGDEFGEVESVKAVSPLYSPVTGQVIAANTDLPNRLEVLGEDPYGAGWMIKVRLSDPACLEPLMDYATYKSLCVEEG